jgi:phage-related protein
MRWRRLGVESADLTLAIGLYARELLASVYRIWYTALVGRKPRSCAATIDAQSEALGTQGKRVPAIFFRTEAGGEPVRDWLKGLSPEDRKRIGEDIKTVEFGWPIGMPVCRPLGGGVYEVRTNLAQNRIARVLFYIDKKGRMVLLHGFIKKTQKTRDEDLELARSNKKKHQRGLP